MRQSFVVPQYEDTNVSIKFTQSDKYKRNLRRLAVWLTFWHFWGLFAHCPHTNPYIIWPILRKKVYAELLTSNYEIMKLRQF